MKLCSWDALTPLALWVETENPLLAFFPTSINKTKSKTATSCQRSGATEPLVISSASTVKQTPTKTNRMQTE